MAAQSSAATSSQHRRRSSLAPISPSLPFPRTSPTSETYGSTSGTASGRFGQQLEAVPGTPGLPPDMSLSRSPSPQRSGGWSSPGLTTPYNSTSRQASPARSYVNGSANNVTWATAQARSAEVRGYPQFSPRNQGFTRHFRRLSVKLPYFSAGDYSDKEKLGRGRPGASVSRIQDILSWIGRLFWKLRSRFALVIVFLMLTLIFYITRK